MINLILKAAFPVTFNLLFFCSLFYHNEASVWTAFLFVNLSYASLILLPAKLADFHKRKVLSWTIYGINWAYFTLELLIGIVILLFHPINFLLPFACQLILAMLFIVVVLSSHLANEATTASLDKQAEKSLFIKTNRNLLRILIANASDGQIKKELGQLLDKFAASPLECDSDFSRYESDISRIMTQLEAACTAHQVEEVTRLKTEIIKLLNIRNQTLG